MSLKDAISDMESTVDKLIKKLTSTQRGLGRGTGTSSNFLSSGLGGFSSPPAAGGGMGASFGGDIGSGVGRIVGGVSQMMPNVSATMDRMSTFYGATIRAGRGMSRNQIQEMTMRGLAGGMTSPGSDAMVAGQLTMRGMIASADYNSTYQETLRGVSGAAQYLNMSNERAATAIERMTAGPQSAQMLRNFGISTADPRTGKEKTQGQIFQELYGRLTAGRGVATEKQVMESYRRGALGSTLRNSGMSQDQQQMFVQYAVERARGNNLDLSDPEAVEELMNKAKAEGNENPNLPGYDLNTSKTDAMQSAQEAYLAGIKLVTPALQGLTEAAGEAASVLGGFKSGAGLFAGDNVGQGLGQIFGGTGQLAMGTAAALMAAGKLPGFGGKGSSKAGNLPGSTSSSTALKTAAKAVTPVAAGLTAFEGFNQGQQGEGFSLLDFGLAAGTGATAGFAIGGPIGSGIGAAIGGITYSGSRIVGSMFDGGEGGGSESAEADSGQSQKKSPRQLKLMHPTASAQITAHYGQRESSFTKGKITWPDGHKGVDYAGSKGDTIFASADGYATLHDGGQLGKRVRVKHESGHTTHYCHLSGITIKEGPVKRGQPIGKMGNTGGKSTGVHLHFALSSGPTTATHMDPAPYMEGSAKYSPANAPGTEQSAQTNDVTSAGSLSGASDPGGEDSSAGSSTSATNSTPAGTSKDVANPGGIGGGSSSAADLESHSAANHYSTGGGKDTSAAPEGGENSSDQPGYLSEASSERAVKKSSSSSGNKTVNNTVTINVSVEKGTQEEARRFSQMLKKALEDEEAMKRMARN